MGPSSSDSPIWRPYTQEKTARPAIRIDSAQGAYLTTSAGERLFDGISSWWTIAHGHCDPRIVEAVRAQAGRLDQVIFANFTHEPAEELAEAVLRATKGRFQKAFFSDNGSTAVEVALKIALQACAQTGQVRRKKFLAFSGAYHGDTVGAMSVSGLAQYTAPYDGVRFEVVRARQPRHSQAPVSEWVADFEVVLERTHEDLAAVLIEPLIQGAAGMVVWPPEALREVARLCRERGVCLIFDEVMTGFGRTGRLFAMDRADVAPDLICLSKALTGGVLPLGLTLATDRLFEAFYSDDPGRMLFHGHSFTGNPIACAAATANLRIFEQDDVIGHLARLEAVHRLRLAEASRKLPLFDARACGTVAAIELRTGEFRAGGLSAEICRCALAKGIFIRPLGDVLYLLPPYCTTVEQLNLAWDVLIECAAESC